MTGLCKKLTLGLSMQKVFSLELHQIVILHQCILLLLQLSEVDIVLITLFCQSKYSSQVVPNIQGQAPSNKVRKNNIYVHILDFFKFSTNTGYVYVLIVSYLNEKFRGEITLWWSIRNVTLAPTRLCFFLYKRS